MPREYKTPNWYEELTLEGYNRTSHFFILSYNVYDYVFPLMNEGQTQREFPSIRDFLQTDLMESLDFEGLLCFSETTGFGVLDENSYKLFSEIIDKDDIDKRRRIEWKECKSSECQNVDTRQALEVIGRLLNQRDHKIVIILEFLENLAPSGSKANIHTDKMGYIEMLRRIAMDENIENTENLIIGLTDNIGGVDSELRRESRCRIFDIPLPQREDRLRYLKYLDSFENVHRRKPPVIGNSLGKDRSQQIENLAEHTHGFNYRSIDEFIRKESLQSQIDAKRDTEYPGVTLLKIQERRKQIIQKESRELLLEVTPRGGFEAVGDLTHIKKYLETIINNLKLKRIASIPKGILLAGPPGTGKTIIAEALAKQAEINMVKMGSIKSKWVGESERNLDKVFRMLKDMAPVVVFIDEIDQAIGGRVTSSGGDGGSRVSASMFGKVLEEMGSNENRGKILWICATNRPDVMDAAMIRRFDRIFPVLLPYTVESRNDIFKAMGRGIVENFEYPEDIDFSEISRTIEGYSGSEIEQIVRDAVFFAECSANPQYSENGSIIVTQESLQQAINNFKTNRDDQIYHYQTLLALKYCRNLVDLPKETEVSSELQDLIKETKEKHNNDAINQEIERLGYHGK